MNGPEMLVKSIATLIGVEREELQTAWEKTKDALPQLAAEFKSLNDRIGAMEATLSRIEAMVTPKDQSGIGDLTPIENLTVGTVKQ